MIWSAQSGERIEGCNRRDVRRLVNGISEGGVWCFFSPECVDGFARPSDRVRHRFEFNYFR